MNPYSVDDASKDCRLGPVEALLHRVEQLFGPRICQRGRLDVESRRLLGKRTFPESADPINRASNLIMILLLKV